MKKIYIEPHLIVENYSLENCILEGSVQGLGDGDGDNSGVKPGWSDDDGGDDDDPRTKERNPWDNYLW